MVSVVFSTVKRNVTGVRGRAIYWFQPKKMTMNDFHIYHNKFQSEADKALGWYIKSWKLKDEDKEIALLYQKKHNKQAKKYLKKANIALKKGIKYL